MPELLYTDHIGLWRDELAAWVPGDIFDAHVHLGPASVIGPISPERKKGGLCSLNELTWEDLSAFYKKLYKDKRIRGVFAFPFPFKETKIDAANDYIIGLMKKEEKIKGFLLTHPSDLSHAVSAFSRAKENKVKFYGVKTYFDLLGKSVYETAMPELVPDDLLDFMNGERLILMLHTSGIGVGDQQNQGYLRRISREFPQIKIILAHMGRFLDPGQFFSFLSTKILDDCPGLFLDISYVSCTEVYQKILSDRKYRSRLLFAADPPWGLTLVRDYYNIGGVKGLICLTRKNPDEGNNAKPDPYAAERAQITYNTYHCLKAVKDAFAALEIRGKAAEELKEDIFWRNTCRGLLEKS